MDSEHRLSDMETQISDLRSEIDTLRDKVLDQERTILALLSIAHKQLGGTSTDQLVVMVPHFVFHEGYRDGVLCPVDVDKFGAWAVAFHPQPKPAIGFTSVGYETNYIDKPLPPDFEPVISPLE